MEVDYASFAQGELGGEAEGVERCSVGCRSYRLAGDQQSREPRQVGLRVAEVLAGQTGGIDPRIVDGQIESRVDQPVCKIDLRAFAEVVAPRLEGEPDQQHFRTGREALGADLEQKCLVGIVGCPD